MVDAGPEPTYEEKTRVPPPPGHGTAYETLVLIQMSNNKD